MLGAPGPVGNQQLRTVLVNQKIRFPMLGLLLLGGGAANAALAANPGEHIRAGNTVITPSVSASTFWRSNPYLADGSDGEDVRSGAGLLLRPALELKAKNSDYEFNLGANYTGKKYFTDGMDNLNRWKDFEIKAGLRALPDAKVGFQLQNDLRNSGRETDAAFADDPYQARLEEKFGGAAVIRPGSSMELTAGGQVGLQKFTSPTDSAFQDDDPAGLNNRTSYGLLADYRWRFFPKTAVVVQLDQTWFRWERDVVPLAGVVDEAGDPVNTGKPDGSLLHAMVGVNGRFTEKVALKLLAGYGQVINDESSVSSSGADLGGDFALDYRGFALNSEIAYSAVETQKVSFGYRHDFQDVYFTNFQVYDDVFLRYSGTFIDRLTLNATVSWRVEDFGGSVVRSDRTIRPHVEASYAAKKFLSVNAGLAWAQRSSPGGAIAGGGTAEANDAVGYSDVAMTLGATFTY